MHEHDVGTCHMVAEIQQRSIACRVQRSCYPAKRIVNVDMQRCMLLIIAEQKYAMFRGGAEVWA